MTALFGDRYQQLTERDVGRIDREHGYGIEGSRAVTAYLVAVDDRLNIPAFVCSSPEQDWIDDQRSRSELSP